MKNLLINRNKMDQFNGLNAFNAFGESLLDIKNMEVGHQIDKGKKKTIIEYRMTESEAKKLVSVLKKKFSCGGYIKQDENGYWVSILNGDHRALISREFINNPKLAEFKVTESNLLIHGG